MYPPAAELYGKGQIEHLAVFYLIPVNFLLRTVHRKVLEFDLIRIYFD